jgi:hypothetical protein
MVAIAKVLVQTFHLDHIEVETLKSVLMFCAVGLTVALLFATYGLDLSPGFF